MKTLKQIREEYDTKDHSVLNEASGKSNPVKAGFPNMPSMLLFKRVTYRIYPNNQLVALYYSRMIDKYLTIPFSKEGVLQMSEAIVHDSEEQLNELLGPALAVGGEMIAGAAGRAITTGAARAVTSGAGRALVRGGAGRAIERAVTKVGGKKGLRAYRSIKKNITAPSSGDDSQSSSTPAPIKQSKTGDVSYEKPKTGSSWTSRQKQIQENKITDIRKMVKEGIDSKDLNINGRTITLNNSMAKRILEVYDSVNTRNKKIVENMLNEDLESFKKLLNFSIRN